MGKAMNKTSLQIAAMVALGVGSFPNMKERPRSNGRVMPVPPLRSFLPSKRSRLPGNYDAQNIAAAQAKRARKALRMPCA